AWPMLERTWVTTRRDASDSVGMTAAWWAGPCRPTTGLRPISGLLLAGAIPDLVDLDAALARDPLDRDQPREARHRGPHHVVRVVRAEALGEDVGDAGTLEHRAHRAAGDHAGAARRGLQQHPTGAVLADDLVRDGGADPGDRGHRGLRGLDGLAHRLGDLVRLAGGDPDAALAVADRHEGVERE